MGQVCVHQVCVSCGRTKEGACVGRCACTTCVCVSVRVTRVHKVTWLPDSRHKIPDFLYKNAKYNQ